MMLAALLLVAVCLVAGQQTQLGYGTQFGTQPGQVGEGV